MVTFTKVANLAKCAVGTITNLALMAKKKQPKRTAKLKQEEEYFNYGKKGHFAKDCHSSILNKKKSIKSIEEAKHS